ncbi:hypothetical protein AAG570_013010 [Ranatra chinensis]|uniref:G-protein coupled receptors family 1 profile domain-containing protein n=1 Tax=Ranatra chinensis TaxID=642074 RepID=A0ABD0YFM4_9HEMI
MSSYTSVLTIVAFSMERYLAICHPLHSYTMSGLDRAIKIVGLLWFISFLSALPFSAFCAMLDENIPPHWPLYELSSFLFFFIPLLIIIVLYVRIGVRIDDRSRNSLGRQVEGAVHGETRHSQSRKSIIRMLSAVVIAFFLCWAPFHAQRLMYLYARNSPHYETINEWMYYITGCFYYFSSTINPILYNLMSIKYRLAFKQTLCGGNATIPRELNSSFRETYVCVNGELRKSHRGTKNQSSNNQNTPSELVVTAAQSSSIKKSYGSRTRTKQWPKTLLRVTIRPSLESTEIESEANEIQSVQTIPKQNCEPPSGFIEQVQIETSI